jgi:hypothetical protein
VENKNKEIKKLNQKAKELEIQCSKLTKEIKAAKEQFINKKFKNQFIEISSTLSQRNQETPKEEIQNEFLLYQKFSKAMKILKEIYLEMQSAILAKRSFISEQMNQGSE